MHSDVLSEEAGLIADKMVKAERQIAACPHDTEAWSVLIRDCQNKRIEDARPVYERLVNQFPTSGRYWKLYIEQEMKVRNYEKVEKLFQRCLMKVLNIDLWKCYLTYIKETKCTLPSYREKMAQAYDFALEKIGMDIMSYPVWAEYIAFLKSVEAVGNYAESQRISAVRKVYQRGIVTPMLNIEQMWKEYCAFENGVNPIIAKKMQEDRLRDYLNSKRATKEYETFTKGLNKSSPAVPPQNNVAEAKQVQLWKAYIQWEKSNPLRTEDIQLLTKRVMFAYEQCLLCMAFHPDMWIESASYLEQASKVLAEKGADSASKMFADEAAALYERAISSVLKSCILIYFAFADFEESRLKVEKVHSIYKRVIELSDVDPTLAYIQYMRFTRRAEGIKSARIVFKTAREDKRTKYQLYVAAALMEYYCSKDSSVALKIFELAIKRYDLQPDCVREYIDFMSQLNEDNNTRVLYERVLTSGQISPENSREIWNKFLEFEVNIGDLASILKVEKRRLQCMGSDAEGRETALMIDRYKYLDLLPCTANELKAIGYIQQQQQQQQTAGGVLASNAVVPEPATDTDEPSAHYPRPDFSQMLPFKPKAVVPPGAHIVPGGVFPPPPAACDLLQRLPPPSSFQGPFVIVDMFIEHFKTLKLPEDFKTADSQQGPSSSSAPGGGIDVRVLQPDAGTQYSIDIALGRKRKVEQTPTTNDESDEDSSHAPPVNDIYRQRQQKKVR